MPASPLKNPFHSLLSGLLLISILLSGCTAPTAATLPGSGTAPAAPASPAAALVTPTEEDLTQFAPTYDPAFSTLATAAPTVAAHLAAAPSTVAAASAAPGAVNHTPSAAAPSAEHWQEWPVIPTPSAKLREIYQLGLAQGNHPRAFSKIGDCQNVASYFLGPYDHPGDYRLGQYTDLQATIDQFAGSFARKSAAVQGGFNVASVLSPLKADPAQCNNDESPLECEYRLNKPSIAFISMEQWWGNRPASIYEKYLRQIVDFLLARGVVPILATKADNLEGDQRINAAIARVAFDYDLPLWNFWRAVQPLPGHGLWKDGFHLTYAQSFFDDPLKMREAWPVRNLTALQTLTVVWRSVSQP